MIRKVLALVLELTAAVGFTYAAYLIATPLALAVGSALLLALALYLERDPDVS